MRDLLELALQFVLEYIIYTATDAIYGTKSKPQEPARVRLARLLLSVLLGYIAVGLVCALVGQSKCTLPGLYPTALVVTAVVASALFSAIVALGEIRLGNMAIIWMIGGVWILLVIGGARLIVW